MSYTLSFVAVLLARMGTKTVDQLIHDLKFGQEIVRNCRIRQLWVEHVVRLGSAVEESNGILSDVPVIFRVCEVHVLEYSPGAKFR